MSYLSTCRLCKRTAPTDQFDQHHVSRRSKHTINDTIPLCRLCHMWVEEHPKQAQEMGLLDYSPRYQTERDYHAKNE